MSAETKLDADAFMRKYLERPSDATARLVFADWLEETGEEHNAAWAHFIRLKHEADRYPVNSPTRYELDRHAGQYAVHIRARLAIPAKLFVGYPKSLLELLPSQNITVRLGEFEIDREKLYYLPESLARENLLFPLDVQDRVFLIAATNPADLELLQKLEFILNRDIVLVAAEADDIQDAIDREYGRNETESVDSYTVAPLLTEFTDPASFVPTDPPSEPPYDGESVIRLVNLIIQEATNLRADGILITPETDRAAVRYRYSGGWTDRDRIPSRFLAPVTRRIALMAMIVPLEQIFSAPWESPLRGSIPMRVHGVQFRLRVTIQPSSDGPTTQIDLVRDPSPTA